MNIKYRGKNARFLIRHSNKHVLLRTKPKTKIGFCFTESPTFQLIFGSPLLANLRRKSPDTAFSLREECSIQLPIQDVVLGMQLLSVINSVKLN